MGKWITDEDGIKFFIQLEYQKLFEIELLFSTHSTEFDSFACCFFSKKDKERLSAPILE